MKIEYLEIKNYKQFTDLTLDLTYPKGHEKEGQPLDKICIIGQSGTGKTNLLKIIKNKYNNSEIKIKFLKNKISTDEDIYLFEVDKNKPHIETLEMKKISFEDRKRLDEYRRLKSELELEELKQDNRNLFKFDNTNIFTDILNPHELTLQEKIHKVNNNISDIEDEYFTKKKRNIGNKAWKILKKKINNYEIEKGKYSKKISNKMVHNETYTKEEFIVDMKKWEKENENILEKIAEDINSIIKKFNLELKIDENTNSYEELILKDLSNGNIIEYDDVSTGTKNLLSTFIPLKSYNPKDSIILIDEPENSFYPDIQRELTDLYMNVGENNQLIMATHSPLIASSFEPWEVVELKFDKNNQIYREKYYDGENHINNYTLDPRLLTWTSILVDIFDLKEDSFSLREQKLMEYGMLKAEIKAMGKGEERDEKMKKFKKLSVLLGLQN